MQGEPYQAAHDALVIVDSLEGALDGVTQAEVHLVAYLACILSLYRGRAVSDWGYGFVRSEWGAPYSAAIAGALDALCARGYLRVKNGTFRLTDDGREFRSFLTERNEHVWRWPYLDGARGSLLALPAGFVRAALREEPSLKQARLHSQARALLSRSDSDAIHDQFRALGEAVGVSVDDLLVPSVVWLTYLADVRRREEDAAAIPVGAGEPEGNGK